jgi:tRNA 5-methylaminomethyl-2-thiouridine biosynthesis bifunctional protein
MAGLSLVPALPDADVVICAHGAAIPSDPAFTSMPVHTVRGQITQVASTTVSAALKTNLCYGGYISPGKDGFHIVGSTFQKWLSETAPLDQDDQSNLQQLAAAVPEITGLEVVGHRAALRVSSKDRFPIVGALDDARGRYVLTALGSHGIIASLLGAHILADYLRGGPFSVGKSTLNALCPMRFEMRENRRSSKKT